MKKALISGITGQDGAYLAKFLLEKGYEVYGTYRRLSTPNFWRLQYLDIFEKINFIPADLLDSVSMTEAIKISEPDEFYHLAAQSFVGSSFEQPIGMGNITGLGVTRTIEAIKNVNEEIKFYNASTSELYGNSKSPQDENTPFVPNSPYAASKLYGFHMTRIYREGYNMFAANGILFNHESPLRGMEFVTRKITNSVGKIACGIEKEVRLGNIKSKRDWGYAPDYVEAMHKILQQDIADDYVIASGESHSVEEFLEASFDIAGLDYQEHLALDKRFERPLEVNHLWGNPKKAEEKLKWKPKVKFKKLVEIMTKEDIKRWENWQNGERFPWDAGNYPNENKIISKKIMMDR